MIRKWDELKNSIFLVFVILVVGMGALATAIPDAVADSAANRDKVRTGTIAGIVESRRADGALQPAQSNVVVYLDESPRLTARRRERQSKVVIRKHRFEPELTVIPQGATIEFPNSDPEFHSVFSLSKSSSFELGLYRDGGSRSVKFERAGVVDVYCNIHPGMKATIKVVPNSFYAIADSDGRFSIERVPVGRYTLLVWNGSVMDTEIEVRSGRTAQVHLILNVKVASAAHSHGDSALFRRH